MIEIRKFSDGWRWYGPCERWDRPGFKIRGCGFQSSDLAMIAAWANYGLNAPILVFPGVWP